MSLNTTPRTWVTGEVVTAAEMNTEVRDGFTGIQAAWSAYTPTLTNITLGNGTLACASARVGKTMLVRGSFLAGSTTTYAAGNLGVSVPVNAHAAYAAAGSHAVGSGLVSLNGGTPIGVTARLTSATTMNFTVDAQTATTAVTNTNPFTFGTASTLNFAAAYEAA